MEKVKDSTLSIARGGGRALFNFFYCDQGPVNQRQWSYSCVSWVHARANARTMSVANWPRSAFYIGHSARMPEVIINKMVFRSFLIWK